jgi:hypothetical protein
MVPEEIIFIMIITHKNKCILYIYFNNLDNLLGAPFFHTERGCMPQWNRKLCSLDAAPGDQVQMDKPDKECATVTGHSHWKQYLADNA